MGEKRIKVVLIADFFDQILVVFGHVITGIQANLKVELLGVLDCWCWIARVFGAQWIHVLGAKACS